MALTNADCHGFGEWLHNVMATVAYPPSRRLQQMPQIHPRRPKQSTIRPPPRWVLAPTTTAYDLATSEIRPLRPRDDLGSGHLRDGLSRKQQQQPTIWPPTIWPPPRCGSCATTYDLATSEMRSRPNNNSLRSGHIRDMALAPSRQPTIWPPPRCALAPTTTTYDLATSEMWPLRPHATLRSGHLRDVALAPAATTYDLASSEMASRVNNSNNLRFGHLRDGPSGYTPPPPVLSPVPSPSSLSTREPQLRMLNSPIRFSR